MKTIIPVKTGIWHPDEDEILKIHYPHTTCEGVACLLNRKAKSVYDRVQMLGISKSEDFLKSDLSGRINGKQTGIKTRFKAGHPYNRHQINTL